MEFCDPFGWHKLGIEEMHDVRAKLKDFESMTWSQILVAGKHQHHSVSVDDLCSHARKRLVAIGQQDVGEVVSLRLKGTQRVWGILREGIMQVLWWDPDHQVCPSLLKHT
jgi:hypothetical protein